MDKLKTKQLVKIIKSKFHIEHVFSVMLLALIVLLWFLMLLSNEQERFVKNMHIYYIMVIFTIMILVMQASLCSNASQNKPIKFRNLKPSKENQRIVRENIFGRVGDRSRSPLSRGRYAEGFKERDVFYTPKTSYHNTEVRHRNRHSPEIFETPFTSRFKLNTPGNSNRFKLTNIGGFDKSFSPRKTFNKGFVRDFDEHKYSSFEQKKFGIERGFGKELKTEELPDYEDVDVTENKYHDTVEELGIKKRFGHWINNTKEWILKGIIQKLIRIDLDNMNDLCRILNSIGYNLVFTEEAARNERESSSAYGFPSFSKSTGYSVDSNIIVYEYENISRKYSEKRYKSITFNEILKMELQQDLVGKLYGKFFYAIKNRKMFNIEGKLKDDFDEILSQRKDIEQYYTVEGFNPISRYYVYERIHHLADKKELEIKYNSGDSFDGKEWSSKLPTDAQIIMWIFCTCFQRIYRDGSDYKEIIKILHDYKDYHSKYSKNGDKLVIAQIAPPRYAPLYKVISGNKELNGYPGEDNVFSAILLFLHEIKTKKNGIYGSNHRALLEDIFR